MAYVILRHGKLSTRTQAAAATAHNYRQYEVSNADQEAPHPNIEFVNVAERDYWEVASERITEAGITPRRKDAVRCVEIILSASPEWFERNENGRAKDYSQSEWLKDTRSFLTEKYGEKNLIAFQLQQDEKTPHIHAIVVPITSDGRLSARDLFNPGTLRRNQTEYGEKMKAHGLERGIEYSKAKHQPMKRFYGQQNETAAELGMQLGPASPYQEKQVSRPGHIVANPEKWADQESQVMNDHARAQVDAANQRADKAQNSALEHAAVKDQVRLLQKQLSALQELKRADDKVQEDLYKCLAGGEKAPRIVLNKGNELLDNEVHALKIGRITVTMLNESFNAAGDRGNYAGAAEILGKVKEQEAKNKLLEAGLSRYAGGKTRLAELNEQQAKDAAEKVREADARKRWEAEEPARRAQQALDQERQRKVDLNNERLKIEQISGQVLSTKSHIMSLDGFAWSAREAGLQVEIPSKGQLILSIPRSKNRFEHQDLQLGGKEFADVLNGHIKINNATYEREKGRSYDREM